jgi:hypothetical protein
MTKSPSIGSMKYIIEQISQSEVGSHNILIHPGTEALRKLYSSYVKRQLKDRNEIVLILPYYETEDKVREVLLSEDTIGGVAAAASTTTKEDGSGNGNNRMNDKISEHEKQGSLIIKDSVKVYSSGHDNSNNTVMSLIEELFKKAKDLGKDGVTIVADLGSFYHNLGDTQRLVDYELSLPQSLPQYDGKKLKGFCVYHKEDFEKRLTEEQKQKLLQHHEQVFIVEDR